MSDALARLDGHIERYVTQRVAELHGSDEYEQYQQEIFDAPRRRKGDERKNSPFFPNDLLPTNPEAWKDSAVELPSSAGLRTVSLPSPLVLLTETTEWEQEKQVEHYWYQRYRQLIETKDTLNNTPRIAVMWALAGQIHIKWESGNDDHRRARAELLRRAEALGIPKSGRAQLLRELILAAMIQVIGEREREQHHRFGKEWETGEDGKKRQIVPNTLPWHDSDDWLFTETRNATIAELLNRNYPDNDDLTARQCNPIPKVYGKPARKKPIRKKATPREALVPLYLTQAVADWHSGYERHKSGDQGFSTRDRLTPSEFDNPEQLLLAKLQEEAHQARLTDLDVALSDIDDEDREITLRYYGKVSVGDLADQYGHSVDNIYQIANRTMKRLRKRLKCPPS